MAWPAQGTSVGGWLLRCEEVHSRQGPGQAVRQLLGLRAFCFMSFFSSYLGLAGVGGCGGVCMSHLMNLVSFFPVFQQFIENKGFGTFSVKIFAFLFYLGRKVCGFFYPRLKTFFPCLASLAARGSHTCTLVQCCPAH